MAHCRDKLKWLPRGRATIKMRVAEKRGRERKRERTERQVEGETETDQTLGGLLLSVKNNMSDREKAWGEVEKGLTF